VADVTVLDGGMGQDPTGCLHWVERRMDAGVTIVGGWGEIGQAHIRAISDAVAGHRRDRVTQR
jgi:hypothetical protein